MKIGCISDLHGFLPELPDDLDLLLIAGDICGEEYTAKEKGFLRDKFIPWLDRYDCRKVGVAGNHDFYLEKYKSLADLSTNEYPIEILENSWIGVCEGNDHIGNNLDIIGIFGTPLSLEIGDWAYQASEEDIAKVLMGVQADIIISHGPPYGIGDRVLPFGEHVGSTSLNAFIQVEQPPLVINGHIHEDRGVERLGNTTVINCSYCDRNYGQRYKVYVLDCSTKDGLVINEIFEFDCKTKKLSPV